MFEDVITEFQGREQFTSCPECGSETISGASGNMDDPAFWRTMRCRDCEYSWNEVYFFSHNEDVNTCKMLD